MGCPPPWCPDTSDLADRLRTALTGRYTIQRELGRGGMATVYLAEERHPRRLVALKVLDPALAAALGPDRFLREVDLAANLTHPHILPIHSAGEADRLLYYTMPYAAGESLRDRLDREKQLPLDDALLIAREVADALSYAHSRGVIHRDIKPENILLESGHAVVADFGIARAISAAGGDRLTETGLAVGTPSYMSPEQAAGSQDLDGRSDLYSLGCVLYEMLAGQAPFTGPTVEAVLRQHLTVEPPNITNVRSAVPGVVAAAIERALAKTPADRFNPVALFGEALRAPPAAADEGTKPAASSLPRKRRVRRAVAVGLLAAAGLAIALVATLYPRDEAPVEYASRTPVLVGDFGGSAEHGYRDVARDIVTTVLEQSTVVTALPREQMRRGLTLAGRPDTTRVDDALGRELALRGSIPSLVTGRLDRVGRTLVVILRAEATEDSSVIATERGTAGTDDELIAVVEDVAAQLHEALTGRRDRLTSRRPVPEAMTPSLPAYLKWLEGGQGYNAGRLSYRQALELYAEAVSLDPEFAAAWRSLGVQYLNIAVNELRGEMRDSARAAFAEALSRPARMTPEMWLRTQGLAAFANGDPVSALRAYDELHRQYGTGHNNLAYFLHLLGRFEEAAEVRAQAGGRFGPDELEINNHLHVLLEHLGRHDEGLAWVERLDSERSRARWYVTHALLVADWDRADSIAADLAADVLASEGLRRRALRARASVHAARGGVRAASDYLAQAMGTAIADRGRLMLPILMGAITGVALTDSARDRELAAFEAAVAGDTGLARAILTELHKLPARDRVSLGAWPALIEASMAARRGQWDSVLHLLEDPNPGPFANTQEFRYIWWLLAQAHERHAQFDSAIGYWKTLGDPQAIAQVSNAEHAGISYSFAHQRLVVLYARLGRIDEARRHWQIFSTTFTQPDPELRHLIDEAREALLAAERKAG